MTVRFLPAAPSACRLIRPPDNTAMFQQMPLQNYIRGLRKAMVGFGFLTLLLTGSVSIEAVGPQTMAEYRALMGSKRSVTMNLRFRGIRTVDTGASIEDRFLFLSKDGVSFYIKLDWNHDLALEQVRAGSELAPFRMNLIYELGLSFERQTERGLLIVRATPAEVWELRLARQIPPYTGDITEQDLRIRDLINSLRNNDQLQGEYRLFFSRRETLYLVFYDMEGHEVRFQYRRDRWETDELKKVRFLIPGSAYLVNGELKGLILQEKTIPLTDQRFQEVLENRPLEDFFLWFEFQSAKPLRTDQILY